MPQHIMNEFNEEKDEEIADSLMIITELICYQATS